MVRAEIERQDADALWAQSTRALQQGKWAEAIASLERLLRLNPNDEEARALLTEAQVKAALEQSEPKPRRTQLPRLVRGLTIFLLGVVFLLLLAVAANYVRREFFQPRETEQTQELAKAGFLKEAYEHLANEEWQLAIESFEALLAIDPGNQQAIDGIAAARTGMVVAERYAAAQAAIQARDWSAALTALREVIELNSGYKDAQALRQMVEREQELLALFTQAKEAVKAGNWAQAITTYERLRSINLEYEKRSVEDDLFQCYVNRARQLVQEMPGSVDGLMETVSLFEKALQLRPQQPQAVFELDLARRFLRAQELIAAAQAEAALPLLESIVAQQPDYAAGAALASLQALTSAAAPTAPAAVEPAATVPPPAPTPLPTRGATGSFLEQVIYWFAIGDAALDRQDYAAAEQAYREASYQAIHIGLDSARWVFSCAVRLATAQVRSGQHVLALQTLQSGLKMLATSAEAIPTEDYEAAMLRGDAAAGSGDWRGAIGEYQHVIEVFARKCTCRLDGWRVLL